MAEARGKRPQGKRAKDSSSFECPLMSPEDAAAATVAFEDLGRLPDVANELGFAIVTGVVEDPSALEAAFEADLAELGARLDARLPVQELGELDRCQRRGLPQGRFAWACRLDPGVRRVYEALHGCVAEDLVVAIDNPFFAPRDKPEASSNRSWPHVDHNEHDFVTADWEVWQGLLFAWPSDTSHASTTVVWPRSHLTVYPEIMSDPAVAACGRKGKHFTPLPAAHHAGWVAAARRVPVPAGSLLVWNSRTVHQGWGGGPRLAQPVCWEPRERRSAAARERKLRCAALGLPTTHWASLGQPHNLVTPEPDSQGKLRASIQPLPATQPVAQIWKALRTPRWDQPLPPELAHFLNEAVTEEIKAVL